MRRRIGTVLVFATCLAVFGSRSATAQAPSAAMMAPEVLQYKLGVYLVPTYFQDPVYGGVSGMYVNTVYANQPAHLASVEVGDVIVRVNGRPVRSYAEYNNAINASGGYASLRVRDVRTGGYLTTQPLQLIPSYPQYGPGDGYGP